jgi:putative pyruvate formate lyase activating enzyme
MDPKYLTLLAENKLEQRVEALESMLTACNVCPKDCGNDRTRDEIAACYSGSLPIVSSYTAHFGEEPVLSGTHGAGNIFFGNCNLRCVYCQNYQISQMWKQQRKNEVTHSPTHFAPQMARAILIAARQGLRLPIVYNTNAYDSVEVLRLLDGIVDVYLPDLKYADSDAGFQYSKVRDYALHARAAIKEMYRQMGDSLVFGEDGLLKRGLLIRLLVLPNDIAGIEENLRWIRDELSPRTAISLMAQYYATNKAAAGRSRDRGGLHAGIRIRIVLLPT